MPQQPAATPTSVTGRKPVGGDEASMSTSQADVVEKQHNSEYINIQQQPRQLLVMMANMADWSCV